MHLAPNWKVIFTYEDANCIVYLLAKYGYNIGEDHTWIEDSLFVIAEILQKEKHYVDECY